MPSEQAMKIGDWVECVDDSPHGPLGIYSLKEGVKYQIKDIHMWPAVGMFELSLHGIPQFWDIDRFRKVEQNGV